MFIIKWNKNLRASQVASCMFFLASQQINQTLFNWLICFYFFLLISINVVFILSLNLARSIIFNVYATRDKTGPPSRKSPVPSHVIFVHIIVITQSEEIVAPQVQIITIHLLMHCFFHDCSSNNGIYKYLICLDEIYIYKCTEITAEPWSVVLFLLEGNLWYCLNVLTRECEACIFDARMGGISRAWRWKMVMDAPLIWLQIKCEVGPVNFLADFSWSPIFCTKSSTEQRS